MAKIATQAEFMARMQHGIIRTNKFEVSIMTPAPLRLNSDTGSAMKIFCKSIKESDAELGIVDNVYRMGRQVKYAGDRVFGNMIATFYGTEETRTFFLDWSNSIDNFHSGYMADQLLTPLDYMSVLSIVNFDPHGNAFRGLRREYPNIFPVKVGGMDLDHGATNQADIFTVEFAINWTDFDMFSSGSGGGYNNDFYVGDVLTGNAGRIS